MRRRGQERESQRWGMKLGRGRRKNKMFDLFRSIFEIFVPVPFHLRHREFP